MTALSHEQLGLLASTTDMSGIAALLVPRSGDGRFRGIDGETLELLDALRVSALIPDQLLSARGDALLQDIARLVLDEVLEVEGDTDFLSGPQARGLLVDALDPASVSGGLGRIGRLSLRAIRRAAQSSSSETEHLAKLLYFANRAPVTARLWERWPDEQSVIASLPVAGLDTSHAIDQGRTGASGWILWHRRGTHDHKGLAYKAYVSPWPDDVPAALNALSDVLRQSAPPALKVGKDAYGLCRPDKLVVYFATRDELLEFAELARAALDGMPCQGVPFTAAVDDAGVVSWGIDPSPRHTTRGWLDHESWRMWVTSRIAGAITRLDPDERRGDAMWEYVLGRLAVEGVDTRTWAPPDHAESNEQRRQT